VGQSRVEARLLRADWSTPSVDVVKAVGQPCPAVVFANTGDEAYGRFLLDAVSERAAAKEIAEAPAEAQDPLLRTMLWGALWDNVHVARSAPRGYIELALKSLPGEMDESLARVQGARIGTALHSYVREGTRKALVPHAEAIIADRMVNAPTLGLRIVSFRTFTGIAETPGGLQTVKDLLSGKLSIAGLTLKPLDRWNLIGHLLAMNDAQALELYAAEKVRDKSGEGQKYAYAVEAGRPSGEIKARYFEGYVHSQTIQEDWITQSLRPFNAWNQTAFTAVYLRQALDELPEIKQHRKIFFLGAWLGAFIDGQNTIESSRAGQATVRAWLARGDIDPDLRLKVLEAVDSLERTALIAEKFSE
jgi:aminopeptidase N